MKKRTKSVLLSALAATFFTTQNVLASMTPVGLWKTIDEDTNEAKSYVRIVENNGVLSGTIETLLNKDKQNAVCSQCSGDKKDQPILGMTIIDNVIDSGDGSWEDGQILDPNNGKSYTVRLTTQDAGEKLEVRGYIGFFYRNQYWLRVE